jgi:phosphopentomutase
MASGVFILRDIIAVLDSFGIGATPDAARFGDASATSTSFL